MKSKVYFASDEEFRQIISSSYTYSDCLRKLGLSTSGGNSTDVLKRRIKELKCDISHFTFSTTPKDTQNKKIPLSEILVENSTYVSRQKLKNRILKAGLLEYKCCECGLENIWNNKPLNLTIHHKNGIKNDNRIENLGFLCPNCHSQTPNFSGKNKKQLPNKNLCIDCGVEIYKTSTRCRNCAIKFNAQNAKEKNLRKKLLNPHQHKVDTNVIIKTYENTKNIRQTAKMTGYNRQTISKILKENNIPIISATTIAKQNNGLKVNMMDKKNQLLETFDTFMEAGRFILQTNDIKKVKHIAYSISLVCKGKRKTAYGYKWEYAMPNKEDNADG